MLKDIVAAQPLENYRLHLRFEDGIEGVVDLGQASVSEVSSNRSETPPSSRRCGSIRA